MTRSAILTFLCVLSLAVEASAQGTVFLIRHAERADSVPGATPAMNDDPDLSDAGRARAASLTTLLKDAGITAIFVTEFKRTQQTATPLAKALGITVTTIKGNDNAGLLGGIKKAKGNVLVVGHSNTVPEIVKALGISTPVTIGTADFDNLFIISTKQPPQLLRLHYR